ncbi:helix-turn-helix transcriptional regulator [Aerococcaceae bacterium NML190938]|nr:helix-turn-helix transcriptional regulator [Aerococcaceae bacterium NML190938]
MIRCNLNTLLAERGLKMSKVINDTKVTRPTLTAIVQNNGKGIQFETLNTLCNYLNVTPCEFFSHIPYDFEYSIGDYKEDINGFLGEEQSVIFELFITIKDRKGALLSSVCFPCTGEVKYERSEPDISEPPYLDLKFEFSDADLDILEKIFDNIESSWKYTIRDGVKQFLESYFTGKKYTISHRGVEELFDILSILI